MYKIIIKQGNKKSLRVITVYKEEKLLNFIYWNAVERVLCSIKAINDFNNHYVSKYNIATELNDLSFRKAMQSAG